MLLHRIVTAGAARWPERVAFRCRDRELTYRDLRTASASLANVLIAGGVQHGDRVGILTGKSAMLPVAIYGTLEAGAAYVPLDHTAPPARLEALIADCGIRVLITDPERRRLVSKLDAALDLVIGPDAPVTSARSFIDWQAVLAARSVPPDVPVSDDDLAYIIYTSGSTGQPKGIMHSHASASAYACAAAEVYGLGPDDVLSNFPPINFDQSIFDFFSGPQAGATTVLIPEDVMRFPRDLAALIERERLTVWYSVPMPLLQMLAAGALEGCDVSGIRWVLYGGESFPPRMLPSLFSAFSNATISNVYGPAETNQCTLFNFDADTEGLDNGVPIGRAWPWAKCRVADPLDPAREAVEGELLVSSATTMRGYWGDSSRDPFVAVDGRLFYRTGDIVRTREDGLLEFAGRHDRMIKSRGQRVELDEVEAALGALPIVAESAVYAEPDEFGGKRIIGAVIPASRDVAAADILRALRHRLVPAAVPARIDLLDEMPRTSSGKVDRSTLAARRKNQDG